MMQMTSQSFSIRGRHSNRLASIFIHTQREGKGTITTSTRRGEKSNSQNKGKVNGYILQPLKSVKERKEKNEERRKFGENLEN